MLIEHQDRRFSVVRGSDVERDGMFLELSEAGSSFPLMEAFYSDSDGSFSIRGFGGSVPLVVAEQFIASARQLLPPSPVA